MKKVTAALSTLGFALLAFPDITYARAVCPGGNFASLCTIRIEQQGGGIVGNVVQILLVLAIILSLFFLIWGGIRYISSGGDKGKIDAARGTLTAAVVGLVISLVAYAILNFVVYFFTGENVGAMKIPRLID